MASKVSLSPRLLPRSVGTACERFHGANTSVCMACSAIYPSPTYYPCMTEFARSRSPIHTLSEYCAADAITTAAPPPLGAVNASPSSPPTPPSLSYPAVGRITRD